MSVNQVKTLLQQTHIIRSHYCKIAKLTGENFNLLQILKMGHYEVKTHSPILADLLNPHGSHGQGDTFLKLFITIAQNQAIEQKEIKDENLDRFDTSTAKVTMEKFIGKVTEESGGRIDIYIKDDHGRCIFIENKIYAQEQENQLLRYYNHGKDQNHSFNLIYLTLNGENPTNIPADKKEEVLNKVMPISYKKDIIQWLELCRKEVATVPIVRESLTQYINLLKHLTHQNTNSQMSTEIAKTILYEEKNYHAFKALVNSKSELYTIFSNKFKNDLELDYDNQEQFDQAIIQLTIDDGSLFDKAFGFEFYFEQWNKHGFSIRFQFDLSDARNFAYGIYASNEADEAKQLSFVKLFKPHFGESYSSSSKWPIWGFMNDPYRYWMEGNTLVEVHKNPEYFFEELYGKLNDLTKLADDFCNSHSL